MSECSFKLRALHTPALLQRGGQTLGTWMYNLKVIANVIYTPLHGMQS